ncbi:microsomal signal peptidase 12 kDa subunit [Phlegmacium glaucopus]|nr:microsomal signal peptidase 12 kDa subunit [Phlegmacium glaucopus]
MASFIQEIMEGKIDFAGQKSVESISRVVLVASTVASFIIGFALQDMRLTFAILALTSASLLLVVLPPWPMFNRHPVKWLPVDDSTKSK